MTSTETRASPRTATQIVPLYAGGFGLAQSDATPPLIDKPRRRIRSIVTTIGTDRAGDVVVPQGLRNREQYLQNPVVLWAHQRQLPPIGICRSLDVFDDRIVAETEFIRGSPLADEIFDLYAEGIIKGWSIGFLPKRIVRIPGDEPGMHGLRIEEWDLLEYSAVPIPENPEAVTLAIRKGRLSDFLRELYCF